MGASKAITALQCPALKTWLTKTSGHYTAPPQELSHDRLPGNEYIESSTMNIHNFAKYLTERRGSSTMPATSGWLSMQLRYPQAR